MGVETALKDLEVDIGDMNEDLGALGNIVKNLDNLHRKNIIKIRGLKEKTEGSNLPDFLRILLSS